MKWKPGLYFSTTLTLFANSADITLSTHLASSGCPPPLVLAGGADWLLAVPWLEGVDVDTVGDGARWSHRLQGHSLQAEEGSLGGVGGLGHITRVKATNTPSRAGLAQAVVTVINQVQEVSAIGTTKTAVMKLLRRDGLFAILKQLCRETSCGPGPSVHDKQRTDNRQESNRNTKSKRFNQIQWCPFLFCVNGSIEFLTFLLLWAWFYLKRNFLWILFCLLMVDDTLKFPWITSFCSQEPVVTF